MTYLEFIAKLRLELKDLDKIDKLVTGDTWSGDGSRKIFDTSRRPIKDASYTVKVGGVTKTEVTDYTIDKDLGLITFVTAPTTGNDNVECLYRYLNMRDEDYLEIINDGIDHFQWKLWKMATDESTLTTVSDQYEYDCSSVTGILYLLNVWYKTSSGSAVWQAVQELTNWKYYTELQELYVNPTFNTSSLPMKLIYLKSFTKGTVTSATLDIPDKWILPYKYYIYARYYERQVSEKVGETAAVTTLPSYTPAQVMINIAEYYYKKAEEVANKLAPKLPPMPIKQTHQGIAI